MSDSLARFVTMLRGVVLRGGSDDRGATATEYALLVAFIALIIVGGVTLFGSQLNNFFSNIGTSIGIIS